MQYNEKDKQSNVLETYPESEGGITVILIGRHVNTEHARFFSMQYSGVSPFQNTKFV